MGVWVIFSDAPFSDEKFLSLLFILHQTDQYKYSSQWSVPADMDHRQNLREMSFTRCYIKHSGKHQNTHYIFIFIWHCRDIDHWLADELNTHLSPTLTDLLSIILTRLTPTHWPSPTPLWAAEQQSTGPRRFITLLSERQSDCRDPLALCASMLGHVDNYNYKLHSSAKLLAFETALANISCKQIIRFQLKMTEVWKNTMFRCWS